MKVENLTNDRGNKAANQFVIKTDNAIYFQSYDSLICKYSEGKIYLTPLWNYSATTRKHLYIFLRDYCNHSLNCSHKMGEIKNLIDDGTFKIIYTMKVS